MRSTTEPSKYAVITDWDEGLAHIEPYYEEEDAREAALVEALRGKEVIIVKTIEYTPGDCNTIEEKSQG